LLTVILAEVLDPGLKRMAEARHTHDRFQLSRWPIEGDAIDAARAMVIAAHSRLPRAPPRGTGETPSRDGPFRPPEALNRVTAKPGRTPGA